LHGSTLPSLLQLLSRLEVFTNHNGLTTYEHVLPLVQSSRETLIRIHVQLAPGPTYVISVALIGQLRKLRHLSVHTPVHDDSASPSIDEISALNLPLLEDLHWTAAWSNPPWISLLARSFFPRLKTVMIVARFHEKHVSGLSQFFRRHSKLKVLTFNTLARTLPSLLQLPISAQVLQFGITVPPAETVFAHCPASVSTLSIPVPETGNSGEVITFLQRAHTLSLPQGLREIRLHGTFSWTTYAQSPPDESSAHFYANVMHCATLLSLKGVRVTDLSGASATIQITR
jgi:hypothetical protein